MVMAPMSQPPPLPGPEPVTDATSLASHERLLGLVRDIRADALRLQEAVAAIASAADLRDPLVRGQHLLNLISDCSEAFSFAAGRVNERLRDVREKLDLDSRLYDRTGDEIAHVENAWEECNRRWTDLISSIKSADFDQAFAIAGAAEVNRSLSEVVFHTGYLTIPARVNQHLKQVRVGQSLDFHVTFADEMPSREDRIRVLRLMQSHPVMIEGVVDIETGAIFHASSSRLRRFLSYLLVVGTALAGAGGIYLLTHLGEWLDLAGWPVAPSRFFEIFIGYLFILAGAIVHLGIDALKQVRSGSAANFIALEDWLLWVHVKEVSHMSAVLSLIAGVLGLAFFVGKVEWHTAFVVGYSIDSFVDLFLQRFSLSIGRHAASLRSELGDTGA